MVINDDISVTAGDSVPVADDSAAASDDSLDGYKVSVYQDGSLVDTTVLPATNVAAGSRVLGASATKASSKKVSHVFANLKRGTYRFYVSAYNSHGRSQVLRTKTVTIHSNAALAHVKSLKASNGKKLGISWGAPAGKISGYTVQVLKGKKVVESIKVKANKHSVSLKKLAAGSYTVRVTAKSTLGQTSVTNTPLTVKKAQKH